MFIYSKKKIKVIEYHKSNLDFPYENLNKKKIQTLSFTSLRLSVALGKTILTNNPRNFDLLTEAISKFIWLQGVIYNDHDLFLKNGFRQRYRDFSNTSRVGELAQAISYIFAQDFLGYPVVLDYDGYLKTQKYIKHESKSPDFILTFKDDDSCSLLESKGVCQSKKSSNFKSKVSQALEQCEKGIKNIKNNNINHPILKSYGVVTEFAEYNDGYYSAIRFVDPEQEKFGQIKYPYELLFNYYSVWFTIAGRPDLTKSILSQTLNINQFPILIEVNNHLFYMIEKRSQNNLSAMCDFYANVDFFISKPIVDSIIIRDYKYIIKLLNEDVFSPESNEKYELFRDGTLAMYFGTEQSQKI